MGTYIGKVQIGATTVPVASSIFGICSTAENVATKQVTCEDFDKLLQGVTVFVRFTNGNSTNTNVTLAMGGTTAYGITGNCVCAENTVLAFVFDIVSTDINNAITSAYWRCLGNAAFPATQTPNAVGSQASIGNSASYALEDHVHNIVVASGDANGQVKIAGQNVSVTGLGSAAYTPTTNYATSAQGTLADNAMPKSGGVFTGAVTLQTDITSSSDLLSLATKNYVDTAINGVMVGSVDAMVFKGTVGAQADNPSATIPVINYAAGWTYRVITAGEYAGQQCEVGDLIVAINDGPTTGSSVIPTDWTVVQGNLDGTVIGPASSVANRIAVFKDATGKEIDDSGYTIATSVPSGAVFTDTTYSLTDGQAYTNHSLTGDTGASILASVTDGVLTLAPGIKFTTSNVGATLTSPASST